MTYILNIRILMYGAHLVTKAKLMTAMCTPYELNVFCEGRPKIKKQYFITESRGSDIKSGESAGSRRVRSVVLLTDDRNLRVKALAAELPARDLPAFVRWAGLDLPSENTAPVNI